MIGLKASLARGVPVFERLSQVISFYYEARGIFDPPEKITCVTPAIRVKTPG